MLYDAYRYALGMFYALLVSQSWLTVTRTKPKLLDPKLPAEEATVNDTHDRILL
jgi:hypothetical protein